MDDLTNHGDEHQPHRTVIENNLFYSSSNSCNNVNNDVQSMDAIERRDFISEQEATGNCLLDASSLIINGTEPRLNLDILGKRRRSATPIRILFLKTPTISLTRVPCLCQTHFTRKKSNLAPRRCWPTDRATPERSKRMATTARNPSR